MSVLFTPSGANPLKQLIPKDKRLWLDSCFISDERNILLLFHPSASKMNFAVINYFMGTTVKPFNLRRVCALLVMGIATSVAHAAPVVFSYSGSIIKYVIATSGIYDITAYGAQGGTVWYIGSNGGYGAAIGGTLLLNAGQTLDIAAGGQGGLGGTSRTLGDSPGGGGGSFVVLEDGASFIPLIIAGGGGGAGYYGGGGGGGQTGTSGGNGGGQYYGAGGSAGNGGGRSTFDYSYPSSQSGGGAGFYSNGGSSDYASGQGGQSFFNGLFGGNASLLAGGAGGFGGGGSGGGLYGGNGGGGGGYSGGGGGDTSHGGGGGGSYFTDLLAFAPNELIATGGANGGNGFITLDLIQTVPEPTSIALFGISLAGLLMSRRRKV